MRTQNQRRNRRRAASLVEFAFVAPIFFLLLMGFFEYARFLFTMQLVNNAAREGARYAVVNTTTDTTAGVQTYVDKYLAGQGGTQYVGYSKTSNITVYLADPVTGQNTGQSWQNATWGNGIGVNITGTYQPIVPGLLHMTGSMTLTGTCVMTVEAN
jgi:Flp pilus assembly protein TadG